MRRWLDLVRRSAASPWLVLIPTMAAAILLSLYDIGDRDLWLDESTSWSFARVLLQRLPELPDVNMTLYYWLLALWAQVVPIDTEAGLRGLSAIFTVLTIPAVYLLTSRLFGPIVAAVATIVVTVDPVVIRFAQEARGYSLLIFLSIVSTLLFVLARGRQTWVAWIGYAVISALALYVHFFAGLVIAAHFFVLLFEERTRAVQVRPIIAYGLYGIGALPLLLAIGVKGGCQIDWIQHPRLEFFLTEVREIGGPPGVSLLILYLALSALAARAYLLGSRDPARQSAVLLLTSWLAVPIVVAVLVSIVQPVLVLRYVTVSLPPLIILGAVGLTTLRPRPVLPIALAGLLIFEGLALNEWYRGEGDERWHQATSHIVQSSEPWDGVIYYTRSGKKPFSYYVQQLGATASAPTEIWTPKEPCSDDVETERVAYESRLTSIAEAAVRQFERVWLVQSHTTLLDPPPDLVQLRASLDETHDLVQRAVLGRSMGSGHQIEVRLYERRESSGRRADREGTAP